MSNVTDCTIDGLTIKDTGGDGIYVGAASDSWSQNVTIKNVVVDNAYRNGISVISIDGILIDNAVIVNTGGTLPQTGIDFEPNTMAHPKKSDTQHLKYKPRNRPGRFAIDCSFRRVRCLSSSLVFVPWLLSS